MKFTEVLKQHLLEDPRSLCQIGRAADVNPQLLTRFCGDRGGLNTQTVDRLTEYLGLELRRQTRARRQRNAVPAVPPPEK